MAGSSRKAIYAALIGNLLISVSKFTAAALTGSSAMISEGVHSMVDTGNQVLLLHGLRRAATPACPRFPFGRGKEVYFWSFVVAILIFAVGAGVSLYEGVDHILAPVQAEDPYINYIVLALSMLFEGGSWYVAMREFSHSVKGRGWIEAIKRGKDPSMFVVLFEDSAAMLGLGVAFVGVLLSHLTGNPYYDGAASIIIGLILGGTAIWLAYETKGLLIGESANPEVVAEIRKVLEGRENIDGVNEILTMHMGPEFILVNISVEFADNMTGPGLEVEIGEIERLIKQSCPRVKRIFIEAESARKKAAAEAAA